MFWLALALLVVLAAFSLARRRRAYEAAADEPWRASLGDDEPLDVEEARRAEEEWLEGADWEVAEDEEWR